MLSARTQSLQVSQGRSASIIRRVAAAPRLGARNVGCNAATAWQAWDSYMTARQSVLHPNSEEQQYFMDIAKSIGKSATAFKPKFLVPHEAAGATFKLQHLDKIAVKADLPKDLHDKLEAIGVATLKGALSLDEAHELDYINASWTTSDIGAALSVTGTQVQKGSERSTVFVFVCTETERQASWSRLEGLILHWACTESPGAAWTMPPDGWTAAPNKTRDAGGAVQCSFEKQTLAGQEQMYVLVLQLPARGALKSGGMTFVLKGTANQADRWLKDNATDKDFYLPLSHLPVTKM